MNSLSSVGARRWTAAEFDELFTAIRTWDRWGPDDQRGALNYLTPEIVVAATRLVRSGRSISMSLPLNTAAGPDNPQPALHYMTQCYDVSSPDGVQFATDFLGVQFHGDCHTHVDALCHIAYRGRLYGGHPAHAVSSAGAGVLDITNYADGIVGRGVLFDVPRHRGVEWLEPGDAVTRAELEEIEAACGVQLREGDIMVFRTGHHRRRLALGPWDNGYHGPGKAGLHVDAITLLAERHVTGFLPDGDGETVPSTVEDVGYPIHPLQIAALGMVAADSLNLEDVADACHEQGRYEFLLVATPLRAPGATGSPFNPIAVL